ncbi:MAG: hypothetical protein ACR2OZ_13945 [Verrucomicrobiales bacterium]
MPALFERQNESTSWGFRGYEREVIERVWQLAHSVAGNDPSLWRKDEFGAWLYWLDYGDRNSQFGWEIFDGSLGRGNFGLAALRPLQWQNYLDLIASETQSRVTADGLRNTRRLL